jgi:hypothetical protein
MTKASISSHFILDFKGRDIGANYKKKERRRTYLVVTMYL